MRLRRSGWLLYLEPAAEVLHHGGRSVEQRWSAAEVELTKAAATIHYERLLLGTVRFRANQLAYCVVLAVQGLWRALRRRPAGTQLKICRLHWAATWQTGGG
jgi:GT2 family glycosyltransferase